MEADTEERQLAEITAIQAVYPDWFQQSPPPKAWAGAVRLHEFIIRIPHPEDEDLAYLHLYTKFPKTYPSKAYPLFVIQQPTNGLSSELRSKLDHALHAEALRLKGDEMVMQIVEFIQGWLASHIKRMIENPHSLATEAERRAVEAERLQQAREEAEAALRASEVAARAAALRSAIDADAERRAAAARALVEQRRPRAGTDATELASPLSLTGDTPTEAFCDTIVVDRVVFDTVKLFHARKDGLVTVYAAEPVCDDVRATLPLELCVIDFAASYYATTQGKKKLRALEADLRKLITLRHPHLLATYAIKLTTSSGSGQAPPRLALLCEQRPSTSVADVLAECDALREERALEYLRQILGALDALHRAGLVHRGLVLPCVGLAPSTAIPNGPGAGSAKSVKVARAAWHVGVLALHKSNPISLAGAACALADAQLPNAWLPREALTAPLDYTRSRDIHGAGVAFVQMLLGVDIPLRAPSPSEALAYSSISPAAQQLALKMFGQPRRQTVSCATLLAELDEIVHAAAVAAAAVAAGAGSAPKQVPGSHGHSAQGAGLGLSHSPVRYTHGSPTTPLSNMNRRRRRSSGASPQPPDYFIGQDAGALAPLGPATPALGQFATAPARASRLKDEWEQLEPLGHGGFGRVFKARLLLDGGVYAVKRVELRGVRSGPGRRREDEKIFREVGALAKLSHRYVVRYYTTWIEEDEEPSSRGYGSGSEDDSESGEELTAGGTVAGSWSRRNRFGGTGSSDEDNLFSLDFSDVGSGSVSRSISGSSFPSVVFERSGSGSVSLDGGLSEDEEGSDDEDNDVNTEDGLFDVDINVEHEDGASLISPTPTLRGPRRYLYIQMEFVEQQTLKERLEDGLPEAEAWKLFHQIVDALVYIANQGIIHRDIKPGNIFIDAKGDCKIGDFGLATSSSSAADGQDASLDVPARGNSLNNTADVGTVYYIAPEVKRRGRSHAKADLYSLGIVFFEMNYPMKTDSERRHVLENVRQPEIEFPTDWDPARGRQRQIIEWLLQHDPDRRPTAVELSQSALMPARVEDEYFRGALRMMAKPDSPHYQAVLQSLFARPVEPSRAYNYDHDMLPPEHSLLNGLIIERLEDVFRLHGAVDMEPTLLVPVGRTEDLEKAVFLDKYGDALMLPDHGLLPMARLAERRGQERIKRFHVGDVYKSRLVSGHPLILKSAVYDIITKDLADGPVASAAEVIAVTATCFRSFPTLEDNLEIRISHAKIKDLVLSRIPEAYRDSVLDILAQPKASSSEKRSQLLQQGILRSVADELQVLNEPESELGDIISKVEKSCPALAPAIAPFLDEIRQVIRYMHILGVTLPVVLHPLAGGKGGYFRDGICFEVTRRKKRTDIFASGGRYDSFLASLAPPTPVPAPPVCATGVQISVDKIAAMLAQYHGASQRALVKEQRSFGYWSPRRCDVYVVSYQSGFMHDRLELAALLWQHGVSADVMYESSVLDSQENHLESCLREGILFTVYPRPRGVRRDQPAYKVKSVLKGAEYDLSRAELVTWLRHEIAEQKRIDLSTSGVSQVSESTASNTTRDTPASADVQLLLPGDLKKQRRQTKQIFLDRAFDGAARVKAAAVAGLPVLALDVPATLFDALVRSAAWVSDDEAWRPLVGAFPVGQGAYAQQIRDAAARRRAEGHAFLLLSAVRDERVGLLTL